MRVTTKGQVTIPQHVREELGIKPHSEVDFIKMEDGTFRLVTLEKKKQKQSRFRRLKGTATVKMTTDEIMALTRR
jgi:AbrB family looped-hinge helix DNA binding protein